MRRQLQRKLQVSNATKTDPGSMLPLLVAEADPGFIPNPYDFISYLQMNMTMTPGRIEALVAALSHERLTSYLQKSGGEVGRALELYEANLKASEAFYVVLHALEVALRNRIDQVMANAYGPRWFETADFSHDTKRLAAGALSKHNRPTSPPGKVVADLGFAYWVSLLGPTYDATHWRQHLYQGFVSAKRPRKAIHARLNSIRRLRNRIAHYEPVLWRDTPLGDAHEEIIEAIGWICPDTADWARILSTAPQVLASLA